MSNKPPISRKTDTILWVIAVILTLAVIYGFWGLAHSEPKAEVTSGQVIDLSLPEADSPIFNGQSRTGHGI